MALVRDGFQPQTNIARQDGQRAALMSILKYGQASTLDIVARVLDELPRMKAGLPPELDIQTALDQSLFRARRLAGAWFRALPLALAARC